MWLDKDTVTASGGADPCPSTFPYRFWCHACQLCDDELQSRSILNTRPGAEPEAMHVVSHQCGLESSKTLFVSKDTHVRPAYRPVQSRGRPAPFQPSFHPAAAPSSDRRIAARVISTRLRPPRFRQQLLHDQMVLQEPKVQPTGVGSPLPHMQECVYLGEQRTLHSL